MDRLEATLPGHCYTTAAFFRREVQGILHAEWFCVGREEELPERGSYLAVDVAGESLLVVRGEDAQLHAHHNVCRHRGSQLVPMPDATPRSGRFGAVIRCPYHAWSYAHDGSLRGAPHLDVDKTALALHGVQVTCWGGFVFVRIAAQGKSLPESLGAGVARIARYPLADLRIGQRIDYEVAANWKVILENYNECYHCGPVHPELCEIVPDFRRGGGNGLDWADGIPHREGAVTFTRSGTTTRAPFPGLDEHERVRHKGELFYPNLMLSLSMDHAAAFQIWPLAHDRTRVRCDFLFHRDEMVKPGFDPADAVELWDITNRQDWAICENVQRGMGSVAFTSGFYAPMEDWSLDMRDYVRARISRLD